MKPVRLRRVDGVQIVGVDERDNHWERHDPRFRVYLHGSGGASTHGWTDTYDVIGADVLQVIDWAQRQAGGVLTYAVALVYDDEAEDQRNGDGRGLVWLVGMDGNDAVTDEASMGVQRRMIARRTAPVGVPAHDRMPEGVPDPYNDGTETR